MKHKHSSVSVIIVAYNHAEELKKCLVSVLEQTSKANEVIVVDNSCSQEVAGMIATKFPSVMYVQPNKNLGFGGGNNFGAKRAQGSYYFFLNPDTQLAPTVLQQLATFLDANEKVAIVGPTQLDPGGKILPRQGAVAVLNPLNAIFTSSFLHRIWPNNPVAQRHWQLKRDYSRDRKMATVPGAALMVRAAVFRDVGKFDEQFFLYFEEDDFCRRVLLRGWEVWQLADARVIHHWGTTTSNAKMKNTFTQSRYTYFKKYYGTVLALIMELLLRIGKHQLLFLTVIFIVIFLLVNYG